MEVMRKLTKVFTQLNDIIAVMDFRIIHDQYAEWARERAAFRMLRVIEYAYR